MKRIAHAMCMVFVEHDLFCAEPLFMKRTFRGGFKGHGRIERRIDGEPGHLWAYSSRAKVARLRTWSRVRIMAGICASSAGFPDRVMRGHCMNWAAARHVCVCVVLYPLNTPVYCMHSMRYVMLKQRTE